MGILVKIKGKKFKLWSTVVDHYYYPFWLTREEAVTYLKSRIMRKAEEECKDIEDTFPNGYYDKDTGRRFWFDEPKKLKNNPKPDNLISPNENK